MLSHRMLTLRLLMLATIGLVFSAARSNASAADAKSKGVSAEQRIAQVRAGLKSTDVATRQVTIKTLTHSDISRALLPELQAALRDADGDVRAWAATVIGPEGPAAVDAVPQLIAQLKSDPFKEARETAARALGRIGRAVAAERRAVAALEQASSADADSVTRVVALGALAMMDHNAAGQIEAMSGYLRHEDALTRMKAAHALGQLGDRAKASASDIAKALEKATEQHQRAYLARAVGQVGDAAMLPIFYAEYAKETEPQTMGEMRGAINRLGGKAPAKSK